MAQNIRLTDENRAEVERLCARLGKSSLNKLVNHLVKTYGKQLDTIAEMEKGIQELKQERYQLKEELSSIGSALRIAHKYGA